MASNALGATPTYVLLPTDDPERESNHPVENPDRYCDYKLRLKWRAADRLQPQPPDCRPVSQGNFRQNCTYTHRHRANFLRFSVCLDCRNTKQAFRVRKSARIPLLHKQSRYVHGPSGHMTRLCKTCEKQEQHAYVLRCQNAHAGQPNQTLQHLQNPGTCGCVEEMNDWYCPDCQVQVWGDQKALRQHADQWLREVALYRGVLRSASTELQYHRAHWEARPCRCGKSLRPLERTGSNRARVLMCLVCEGVELCELPQLPQFTQRVLRSTTRRQRAGLPNPHQYSIGRRRNLALSEVNYATMDR